MARRVSSTAPAAAAAPDSDAAGGDCKLQIANCELQIVDPHPGSYCASHIELRLNHPQAQTLKTLVFSLQASGVEVRTAGDALKWVLDQIYAQLQHPL
jgi:hypothetical protein